MTDSSTSIHVFHTHEPARQALFQFLDWKTLFRLSQTCRGFYHGVKVECRPEYGKPLGDEVVLQHLDHRSNKISMGVPCEMIGTPRTVPGPTGKRDALEVSRIGQSIRLVSPVTLGPQWTICVWTYFEGGRPRRTCCRQSEEWRNEEYALVCSRGDDQHVFYSADQRVALGYFTEDQGFFSSHFSFSQVSDGWHHLAAVGTTRRSVGWWLRGSGATYTGYYLDGKRVGALVPFSVQKPIEFIGNMGGTSSDFSRPWGSIADLRMFRRALSERELQLLVPRCQRTGT